MQLTCQLGVQCINIGLCLMRIVQTVVYVQILPLVPSLSHLCGAGADSNVCCAWGGGSFRYLLDIELFTKNGPKKGGGEVFQGEN